MTIQRYTRALGGTIVKILINKGCKTAFLNTPRSSSILYGRIAELISDSTIIGKDSCKMSHSKACEGKTGKKGTYQRKDPVISWNRKVANTELEQFQKVIEKKHNIRFDSYWELHRWSVQNYATYWEEAWRYCDVISSKPYDKVVAKTGPGFLDNDWFSGAKFNYAENILRIRDDSVALICLDEQDNEEIITFSEMFEEVKKYAAAFRKNGLQKNDRVACYMSNRKEAIFAMLAATSIGAIWGGPLPYYGAKSASNILKLMDPKFLITIDSHMHDGDLIHLLPNLPYISENNPSIEKVILVTKDEKTCKKDLSNIRNCVLLEEFLQEGRTPEGNVPDIIFEQLPSSHPISIIFTSGTTGLPKGIMHSAVTFVSKLINHRLHLNLKRGDVACAIYPVGWNLWDFVLPMLAMGTKLLLFCGSCTYTINGKNHWDILSKYNAKYTYVATASVDKMEKMQMIPSPGSNIENLEIIGIGSSPVKKENIEYILTKIKKDVFVGSRYSATEVISAFNGFCLNMPVYGEEIQIPSLGMDLQCYDEKGNSVIGQRGEMVVCTPIPNFPIRLWQDENDAKLISSYLSKYPGVWCQNDEIWINPKTNGIVVIGRSDDILKQKGERFGSGEIYFAINSMEELQDYICVGQNKYNGDARAVLFVKMKKGFQFTPQFKRKIEEKILEEMWIECVPEAIIEVSDIPYNLNNKRMESVLRKIVENNKIPEVTNIRNPESLKNFVDIPEIVSYNQQ